MFLKAALSIGKGLEASILAEGCRDALVVWGDVLVDGHNRYKICMQHDVPFTTVQKEFADRDEALLWILNNQLSRRNLNDFQRIEMVNKYEDAVKARARERMLVGTNQYSSDFSPVANFPQGSDDTVNEPEQTGMKSRDELGAMAGVSGKTYEHATAVLDKAPEPVVEAARNNELSINAAYEVTKMPEEKQTEVAERIEKGEKPKDVVSDVRAKASVPDKTYNKAVTVIKEAAPEVVDAVRRGDMSINQAYQQVKREEKKQAVQQKIEEHSKVQTGTVDIFKPERKYNIIYADPAWQYWDGGNKNQSLHYSTMPIKDICELPVKNIADDDCALFLWVTYPILREAFDVIEAWGFKYSTAAFVWVKKNKNQDTPFVGLGSWTRANSELCLLATKGNITRLDASVSQIVESPIEEHSRKPAVVRDLITKLVGGLPRIELFCREPADGWDVWGNEA